MMSNKEIIAVVQAEEDGIEIQEKYRRNPNAKWLSKRYDSVWVFGDYDYRIKPEPYECWANIYESSSVGYPDPGTAQTEDRGAIRTAVHMREVPHARSR